MTQCRLGSAWITSNMIIFGPHPSACCQLPGWHDLPLNTVCVSDINKWLAVIMKGVLCEGYELTEWVFGLRFYRDGRRLTMLERLEEQSDVWCRSATGDGVHPDWLTDWLTDDWLTDECLTDRWLWLTDWLTDWLALWVTSWMTDCVTDWWLTDLWLADWLMTGWLTDDCVTDWLTGWLTDWWLADWLADWWLAN